MAEAPPPPPHGSKSSKLPDGNYDIFIIPPHSAGSGFLYLPSLRPNINSFVAGFFTAVLIVGIWSAIAPALKQTMATLNSGFGLIILIAAVGAAFAFGRTSTEPSSNNSQEPGSGSAGTSSNANAYTAPPPRSGPPPASGPGSSTRPGPTPGAASGWEKAREETRKREAERKQAEELKRKQEEAAKKKEDDDKAKRAAAEKEKWEQARAREKDAREREARERLAKERVERERAAKTGKAYERPTAHTFDGTESVASSYRTYETPRHHPRRNPLGSSASSASGLSESSYAPSMSTARTTPPPVNRGPYSTNDPDKIVIQAVYLFNNMFPKPVSQLICNQGSVTDGLILRITTEGLFIDDDVRDVPQREWDVKAWGIKLVETGKMGNLTVFRASLRDTEAKKYVFILPSDQGWKVDMGLERLRKGSQVRAMGMNGLKDGEMKNMLGSLGWI